MPFYGLISIAVFGRSKLDVPVFSDDARLRTEDNKVPAFV
jgi:hypothetical protein